MITINNDVSTQQLEEALPKMSSYHDNKEYDEPLKLEMTPLQEITNQGGSTVVTITSEKPPVRDHIIWSLFNTLYMNFCCLGLVAFVFSIKSRDQKLIGNQNGARSYSATSRSLNIASSVLTMLWIIISAAIVYYNLYYMMATIRSWFKT